MFFGESPRLIFAELDILRKTSYGLDTEAGGSKIEIALLRKALCMILHQIILTGSSISGSAADSFGALSWLGRAC